MVVVVAAAHIAKGLAKMTSWAGFLPGDLADPSGVARATALAAKALAPPTALLPLPVVGAVSMLLVVAAVLLGIREARLADGRRLPARAVPILLLGALFLAILSGWLRGG